MWRVARRHTGCEDFGADVEFVLVTAESTQDYFNDNFRWQPWLAIPFTHTQKRQQLRELFEVDTSKDTFVLISPDGTTITRDGATLMSLAWQCQQAINNSDSVRTLSNVTIQTLADASLDPISDKRWCIVTRGGV